MTRSPLPILYASTASVLALCFLILLAPAYARGQTARGSDQLEIRVNPQAPSPGQQTEITVSSVGINLSQSVISWSVDGVPKASGEGARSFTFTMGGSDRTTNVKLTVTPAQGGQIERTLTFRPGSVLLLWEADTYTPPLYRGRALYSPGAGIRVLAITDVRDSSGAAIAPANLRFKWQMGGEEYADRSGAGRDLLLLTGSQLRTGEEVGVTVLRADGSKAAEATIGIPATPPQVRFYRVDPLRGTRFEQALLGETRLIDTETTVVAEPYFMAGSVRKQNDTHTYLWYLNGNTITPDSTDPTLITLRREGGAEGRAELSFSVQSNSYTKLLQTAQGALTLLLSSDNDSFLGF